MISILRPVQFASASAVGRSLGRHNLIRSASGPGRRGDSASDEDLIKSRTIVSNDHMTPELSLYLITPKCDLWRSKPTESTFEKDPFWAIYWPGGQALSRFILDNGELFSGKNVIDVGSGCGASAIAAAKSNSGIVLANDIDEMSLTAVRLNAELNGVEIISTSENLIGKNVDDLEVVIEGKSVKPKWDIITVGDMFYDADFSQLLISWLREMGSMGKTVLIGDPGRFAMKDVLGTGNIAQIAEYPIEKDEHFGFTTCAIWQIIRS